MNRFFDAFRALVLAAAASACMIAAAQVPAPPEIAARSYLLLDVTANQILAQKDIDSPVEPASLTKLMSAYIVFDALRAKKITLTQTMPVSQRAWKMPGSRMFIDPKMQVPVEDLIKGLIVQSGNDATVALAEGVGGTVEHFVELMNAQAKALGMKNTTYKNPEGLTAPGHTTTARDLSILAMRLVRDFPEEAKYYAIKKYRYPGTPSTNDTNRNLLLFRDPTVDGLKTGHTDEAGYCMVASAVRDGQRLIAVVFGTNSEQSRAAETQKLLTYGFRFFETQTFYQKGTELTQAPVWKGATNQVKAGLANDLTMTMPKGQLKRLQASMTMNPQLTAPIAKGDVIGKVEVKLDEKVVHSADLIALDGVEEAGFFGRMWDSIRLFFYGLFN
jgi:serine-type D-Ala-D-Ala carboxypeptidase (penicillin-binding protein 5/6)